ncbi:MAG: hypothetical protein QOF54_1676, partial [Solirubrobacteraceae bacterium]|nr:hypothetical protein [Solirubrobacteraceae bacterium]
MATGTTAEQIIDVVTPAAGESVTEGTILEWHVQVGDHVEADATIVEISTDKVDVELPAPATGIVTELLVAEGDTVTVGQVIARIALGGQTGATGAPPATADGDEEPDDGERSGEHAREPQADANGSGNGAGGSSGAAAAADGGATGEDPASGRLVDVVTPAAGESVSEGTILEWRVGVGEPIKASDTIVEISTDKVDVELPAPASGTVSELLVSEGDTVTVGQVIARILLDDAEAAAGAPASGDGAPGASATPSSATDDTKVSPVAARVAAVEGVDLSRVAGSGPAGRIVKSDVLSAAGGNGAAGAAQATGNGATASAQPSTAEADVKPLRGGAAMLAQYMEQSRSIPTATSFRTLTVTMLDARRRELKAAGRKVSFTHLIGYAIALAAEEMGVMADHFVEVDGKPGRAHDGQVNLGLAVDVEKKD